MHYFFYLHLSNNTQLLLRYYNDVLKHILTEGENCPITHLKSVAHKLWNIVLNSTKMGSCHISADKKCITFEGTPILISQIPNWYQELVVKAEKQLDKALCGLKFPEFDKLVASRLNPSNPEDTFNDIHSNQHVGYSFLKEKRNGLQKYENALLYAIFQDEKLNQHFHVYNNGLPKPQIGEFHLCLIFNPSNNKLEHQINWFHCVAQLVDLLFLGFHVGPGGVARGTEIATLSMENTESCPRNLFIMHGYLVAALRYNKTRHNSQKDNLIARFIPQQFGKIFLYYAAIIRPLERIWSHDIFVDPTPTANSTATAYRHLVFVRYATPMDTAAFSKVLHNSTLEFLNIGLGISDYRQFIKSVLRLVLGIDYDKEEEDQNNPADASFGHSSRIGANYYGLSYTDLPNLSANHLYHHQKYCQRVHHWLESGTLPQHMDPLSLTEIATMFNNKFSDITTLVTQAIKHCPSQESIASTSRSAALDVIKESIQDVIKESIQDVLVPIIQDTVKSEIHKALANMPWLSQSRP